MRLESIENIVNGMQVFMPSGVVAYISMDEKGDIIVEYRDELDSYSDVYSQDEFGNIISNGIEVFEEPSLMVLESAKKIEKANKLVKIAKTNKDVKTRQDATSLLNQLNLGADDDKEIKKLIKKVEKESKSESVGIRETHNNILELAQQQMKPEEIDHWQSDLYLKKTPISDKLVADYEWKNQVTVFRDNIDNELWYEIPFAYGYKYRESKENKKGRDMGTYKKLAEELNSAINEVSDELANKVHDIRRADMGKKGAKYGKEIIRDYRSYHDRRVKPSKYSKEEIDNMYKDWQDSEKKFLKNRELLNKRQKRNESKINEISDLSANLTNALRYKDLQLKNAEDNAIRHEFGYDVAEKETHPKFKKALDKYNKNSKLLAKRNKRKEQPKNESLYNVNGLGTINDKEYTDRVDVSFEISLGDYGIVRNPKTDEVIYGSAANDKGGYGAFGTTYISLEDVREILEDIEDGFFDYIGSNRETELNNLDNNNLASIIYSINSYGDYFNMGVYEVDNTEEPIIYLESKKVSKMASKINETNYNTDNAWLGFCTNIKRYANEHQVDIEEAIQSEFDDLYAYSDIINIWRDMPGDLGSRISEITNLMLEDIEEGAFEAIDFISKLTESKKSRRVGRKINEKMSVKKAKELYKQQGFLDSKEDKEAIEALKNANYTIKTNSRGTANVIELDRMKEAFEDTMLTDINDLDFPKALADTVETTEEGEVLDLRKISDQISDLKDEIKDELKDIKSDIKDELSDSREDIEDELKDNLEDIEFIKSDKEDKEDKEPLEKPEKEDDEDDEEKEPEKEEKLEEKLFSKYLKKGQYEDLAQTKREIDNIARTGKDAKKMKDAITVMADDDKETAEAQKYAVSKLKESLLNTAKTSKIQLR